MSDTSIIADPLNSVLCASDAKGWPSHDKAVTVFAEPEQAFESLEMAQKPGVRG